MRSVEIKDGRYVRVEDLGPAPLGDYGWGEQFVDPEGPTEVLIGLPGD